MQTVLIVVIADAARHTLHIDIAGIVRIRNEEDIITDTMHHMMTFCDAVVVFDDCSTDGTVARLRNLGSDRIEILCGSKWSERRTEEETRHRRTLLRHAARYRPQWIICMDADERVCGDVRGVLKAVSSDVSGLRFPLFDAYLTSDYQEPYQGGDLSELERLYGPERRDILMAWRCGKRFAYLGQDQREPVAAPWARVVTTSDLLVQHFGKALSVDRWEVKCDYYAGYFPEPYRSKWLERKGKAVHVESDFGAPLVSWQQIVGSDCAPPDMGRESWRHTLRRFEVGLLGAWAR